MKALKLLLASLAIGISFNSCSVIVDDFDDAYNYSLEELVQSHDLWYIDYNKTTGYGDVPFLSKAFTISFINGRIYANNKSALPRKPEISCAPWDRGPPPPCRHRAGWAVQ